MKLSPSAPPSASQCRSPSNPACSCPPNPTTQSPSSTDTFPAPCSSPDSMCSTHKDCSRDIPPCTSAVQADRCLSSPQPSHSTTSTAPSRTTNSSRSSSKSLRKT